MKKTFNLTDLTKSILGTDDVFDFRFESTKRKIDRHLKDMKEILDLPKSKFEAPIEQLESYVLLIKNLLMTDENDEMLNILKKLKNREKLDNTSDGNNLKRLIKLFADFEKKQLRKVDDLKIFDKWLQDQLADDFYIESQKQLTRITNLIRDDFTFFDNLTSLNSKFKIMEQYINDIETISSFYKEKIEEELLFESCFLEVLSSHNDLKKKKIYTLEDFLLLPLNIQNEILLLIEKKKSEKTPDL